MSDRMGEVLSSIDAELTKCICGNPVPEAGVSLDYCSEDCQEEWQRRQRTYNIPGRVALRRAAAAFGPVMGTRPNSDSILVCLSPAESVIPGPNGRPLHIRHAYGDQPMEITEIDMGDLENDDRSTT